MTKSDRILQASKRYWDWEKKRKKYAETGEPIVVRSHKTKNNPEITETVIDPNEFFVPVYQKYKRVDYQYISQNNIRITFSKDQPELCLDTLKDDQTKYQNFHGAGVGRGLWQSFKFYEFVEHKGVNDAEHFAEWKTRPELIARTDGSIVITDVESLIEALKTNEVEHNDTLSKTNMLSKLQLINVEDNRRLGKLSKMVREKEPDLEVLSKYGGWFKPGTVVSISADGTHENLEHNVPQAETVQAIQNGELIIDAAIVDAVPIVAEVIIPNGIAIGQEQLKGIVKTINAQTKKD